MASNSRLRTTFHLARRHRCRQVRYSSTEASQSPLIVRNVPAPYFGSIRILSLNRPAARNALSRELLDRLKQEVHEIQIGLDKGKSGSGYDGVPRALILASEIDNCFCAGADLKERLKFTQEDTKAFLADLRGAFSNFANLALPTISAVSSLAFGGGLELALCTQLRVFGSTTVVGLPETRLAIIPGAGGTYRLPSVIGLNRARDMILTGRRVDAAESYFIGLCNRLVEITPEERNEPGNARQKVLNEAIALARDICEGGPVATRQALEALEGWELGEVSENRAYEGILHTEDRLEALRAFGEKRKPVFKGY